MRNSNWNKPDEFMADWRARIEHRARIQHMEVTRERHWLLRDVPVPLPLVIVTLAALVLMAIGFSVVAILWLAQIGSTL